MQWIFKLKQAPGCLECWW